MDKIILLFCSFVSCIIIINILFQFLNDRFIKVYDNKLLYQLLPVGSVILIAGVNMLMLPVLNLLMHLLLLGIVSYFLYYDDSAKFTRVIEVEVLYIVIVVTETLGVLLLDFLMGKLGRIPESPEILQSMETAFSKLMVLFLYYVVFSRLWKKTVLRTKMQYILYSIMFVYSLINVLAISYITEKENPAILMLIVGCITFSNMYMLYFIKFSDERNYYKMQIDMMQQQEKLQYENNQMQREKYDDAMRILHDVDKHIKQIEELYQEHKSEAIAYTRQINDMLSPLLPFQYSRNPVWNCLLSDKSKMAQRQDIKFEIDVAAVDIDFMKPIDVTTLFGNLIDNAIAAASKCESNKYVGLFVHAFNEMVAVRVTNSISEPIFMDKGKIPDSKKGIGLLNIERCVEAYDGSIIFKCTEELLICDIILNRTDSK